MLIISNHFVFPRPLGAHIDANSARVLGHWGVKDHGLRTRRLGVGEWRAAACASFAAVAAFVACASFAAVAAFASFAAPTPVTAGTARGRDAGATLLTTRAALPTITAWRSAGQLHTTLRYMTVSTDIVLKLGPLQVLAVVVCQGEGTSDTFDVDGGICRSEVVDMNTVVIKEGGKGFATLGSPVALARPMRTASAGVRRGPRLEIGQTADVEGVVAIATCGRDGGVGGDLGPFTMHLETGRPSALDALEAAVPIMLVGRRPSVDLGVWDRSTRGFHQKTRYTGGKQVAAKTLD